MRLHTKTALVLSLASALALIVSAFGAGIVMAHANTAGSPAAPAVTGSAQPATAQAVLHYTREMGATPQATPAQLNAPEQTKSFHTRMNASAYARVKANAKRSAPPTDFSPTGQSDGAASFAGLQSSASICPPAGCNPPDMGLATSPDWTFQGVNTSFAVFDARGAIQPGWPKTFPDFFGIPNPGACAGNIPFTSDPRALYDPATGRFWAAALEVEGAFGVNDCPFVSRYWIAVSQTTDPRGAWNVYAFDMSLGTTNAADFTMIGFDEQAFYFSANMFTQDGTAYAYAEIFGANKARMQNNQDVSAPGFIKLTVTGPAGSFPVDTVQPTLTETRVQRDSHDLRNRVEYFVDTFNGFDPVSNHGCTSDADSCTGLAAWAFRDVNSTPTLTFAYIANTKAYTFAPAADQPTCKECIDSSDLRISATPVFDGNFIYAAWETGVNNGTQVVPGILWSQALPILTRNGDFSARQIAGGYYNFGGDDAVIYPALMPSARGALYMVFDHLGGSTNPEVRLTARRGQNFAAPGALIKAGEAPYRPGVCGVKIPVCRWGDYSAMSYTGARSDTVSFAGQYANASGFRTNWGTWIGRL